MHPWVASVIKLPHPRRHLADPLFTSQTGLGLGGVVVRTCSPTRRKVRSLQFYLHALAHLSLTRARRAGIEAEATGAAFRGQLPILAKMAMVGLWEGTYQCCHQAYRVEQARGRGASANPNAGGLTHR